MNLSEPTLRDLADPSTRVRPRGRPRGTCGPVRAAVARAFACGLVGSFDTLAEHTGWPPEALRRAVYEMSRAGEVELHGRETTGKRGPPRGLFGSPRPAATVDALAFVQQAWR
jgi:hypothetical protein